MKYKVIEYSVVGLNTLVKISGCLENTEVGDQIKDEFNVHYKVLDIKNGPDKYYNGMEETTELLLQGMFSSRKIVTDDLDYFNLGKFPSIRL